jgi:uncharacterized membrane protein
MYELLTFLALLSAAMLAGLMATLVSVMRVMWQREADTDAASHLQEFLRYAARNRVLSTLSIVPVIAAIAIVFVGAPSRGQLVYALLGGGLFLVGFFLVTAVFNLPVYNAIMGWDVAELPAGWRSVLGRLHLVNAVRLAAALASGTLFFLASQVR